MYWSDRRLLQKSLQLLPRKGATAETHGAHSIDQCAHPGREERKQGYEKNYDTRELVRALRGMNITPHVA
jgi:hypothetical protein